MEALPEHLEDNQEYLDHLRWLRAEKGLEPRHDPGKGKARRLRLVDAGWEELAQADLRYAKIEGALDADLAGADLRWADLRGAHLESLDFMDADLREADFRGAFLENAVFKGALLDGANFERCNIAGAVFDEGALEHVKGVISAEEEDCRWAVIRKLVLHDAHLLNMNQWHGAYGAYGSYYLWKWSEEDLWEESTPVKHACGTSHCLAGWAQALSTDRKIRSMGPALAGSILLPRHAYLFFESQDRVLSLLKKEQEEEQTLRRGSEDAK